MRSQIEHHIYIYSDGHLLRTSFGKKTPDGLQVAHLLSGHLEQQTMFLVYRWMFLENPLRTCKKMTAAHGHDLF